ncbi:MAG: FkbM family methyltransferase [Acidimicrobiales bacterium]
MAAIEAAAQQTLRLGRRFFRDTWVHRLPMTGAIYDRVASVMAVPDTVVFRGVEVALAQTDSTITPSLITGEFERVELDAYEALLSPGMTVVDVGANNGTLSAIAAKHVGPTGSVVSIEAIASNVELLERTIALNGIDAVVSVVHCAAGVGEGNVRIYLDRDNSGTHSAGRVGESWIDVPIRSVDEIVQSSGLSSVDLLKIDVEGYESFVLEGASGTLHTHQPIIFCEFDNDLLIAAGGDPARAVDILAAHGAIYLINSLAGGSSRSVRTNCSTTRPPISGWFLRTSSSFAARAAHVAMVL